MSEALRQLGTTALLTSSDLLDSPRLEAAVSCLRGLETAAIGREAPRCTGAA
jgi:hypothetical protein